MDKNHYIHEKLKMGCWHEYPSYVPLTLDYPCKKCGKWESEGSNPTYSSDEWIPKLIARLVELGMWDSFYALTWFARKGLTAVMVSQYIQESAIHSAWLIQQPRFRDLLYDYLKQKGDEDDKTGTLRMVQEKGIMARGIFREAVMNFPCLALLASFLCFGKAKVFLKRQVKFSRPPSQNSFSLVCRFHDPFQYYTKGY